MDNLEQLLTISGALIVIKNLFQWTKPSAITAEVQQAAFHALQIVLVQMIVQFAEKTISLKGLIFANQ